jgi:hypothetical protein
VPASHAALPAALLGVPGDGAGLLLLLVLRGQLAPASYTWPERMSGAGARVQPLDACKQGREGAPLSSGLAVCWLWSGIIRPHNGQHETWPACHASRLSVPHPPHLEVARLNARVIHIGTAHRHGLACLAALFHGCQLLRLHKGAVAGRGRDVAALRGRGSAAGGGRVGK